MKPIRKQIFNNISNAQDCNWHHVNDRQIDVEVWYDVHFNFDFNHEVRNQIKKTLKDKRDEID